MKILPIVYVEIRFPVTIEDDEYDHPKTYYRLKYHKKIQSQCYKGKVGIPCSLLLERYKVH